MVKLSYVTVNPPPPTPLNADFTTTSPTRGEGPLDVHFKNTSTGSAQGSFLWRFGDGATSTQEHPTHTYASALRDKSYTVTLVVTAAGGAKATETKPSFVFVSKRPRR